MKQTILLVEQHPDISHFVCETLKQKKYETIQAGNGTSAIETLKLNTKIDLLLVNFPVADMTGIEFLTQIKSISIIMIPILFMVTELTEEMLKLAQQYDLIGWIIKPYRAETFFAQIESALR